MSGIVQLIEPGNDRVEDFHSQAVSWARQPQTFTCVGGGKLLDHWEPCIRSCRGVRAPSTPDNWWSPGEDCLEEALPGSFPKGNGDS